MIKNLKALVFEDGDYVWDFNHAKKVLDEFVNSNGVTKNSVYEDLGDRCSVTPDAVKNWFVKKNGPGDPDFVRHMAKYFEKDHKDFLRKLNDYGGISDMDEMFEEMLRAIPNGEGDMIGTVRFIGLLNELARSTEEGFMGFKEFVSHHKFHGETMEELMDYEYTGEFYPGIIYIDDPGENHGKIVADMCVDFQHHDIISTYDDIIHKFSKKYSVTVRDEEPDELFIEISDGEDLCIIIEDGRWYCS